MRAISTTSIITIILSGFLLTHAQQAGTPNAPEDDEQLQLTVEHPECSLFGPKREKFLEAGKEVRQRYALSALTSQVVSQLGETAPVTTTTADRQPSSGGTIDKFLFAAMQEAGVKPADKTNDFEFIRRVTLDLTGKIPTAERVQTFVASIAPDKRARLIDELLAKPEWVDKWTMYFGDHLKNTQQNQQVRIDPNGRNAFYAWIKDSLSNNKPYDQMVRDIISAQGTNTWDSTQGAANWMVLGFMGGGPVQDVQDLQTSSVAEQFLGIANFNCVLCHDGRNHLQLLSLWGKNTTRYQAWQMSAFMSHTTMTRVIPDPNNRNSYYWTVTDSGAGRLDYALGSTTGNRPARPLVGSQRYIAPVYPFNGESPAAGEPYRAALARQVTSDFQFARAAVNYMWKEFFGRGIVYPENQFDPARLDPDNPPTAIKPDTGEVWPLQPSNARLLNALAQSFVDNAYDLKKLMRQIANSDAYQLSARYNGNWDPKNESLFARKLVRRLWGEEILDSLSLASNIFPTFNVAGLPRFNSAMQAPEPKAIPNAFLSSFLPGNRDDDARRGEGAIQQALNLMNDPTVMSRVRATGTGANASLLARVLSGTDDQIVSSLYLNVLSRYPTDTEKTTALASLKTGVRTQKAENLLWSLYNKVDFIYNY